jgi:hypothetical protein
VNSDPLMTFIALPIYLVAVLEDPGTFLFRLLLYKRLDSQYLGAIVIQGDHRANSKHLHHKREEYQRSNSGPDGASTSLQN